MNMFANLMGGLIDKEAIIQETIATTIKDLTEELQCKPDELFIMIKPTNEKCEFKCWVYKMEPNPVLKREITLKEILGIENDAG